MGKHLTTLCLALIFADLERRKFMSSLIIRTRTSSLKRIFDAKWLYFFLFFIEEINLFPRMMFLLICTRLFSIQTTPMKSKLMERRQKVESLRLIGSCCRKRKLRTLMLRSLRIGMRRMFFCVIFHLIWFFPLSEYIDDPEDKKPEDWDKPEVSIPLLLLNLYTICHL